MEFPDERTAAQTAEMKGGSALLLSCVRRRGFVLATALIVGFIIARNLIGLASSPPGLYLDEASIGYNAWAVGHTGFDEHGVHFPLYFEAFGEFKNPVYIYTLAALTRILPLTPTVERLPAAIFGLIACIAMALLARRLTGSRTIGLVVLITAALTPWLVLESRVGFEVVSMVAALAVALWCLAEAEQHNATRWLWGAGMAFGVAVFAYSTGRIAIALVGGLLLGSEFIFGPRRRNRWRVALPIVIAYLMLLAWSQMHPGALVKRFNDISIVAGHPTLATVARRFWDNYIAYINLPFLFVRGDPSVRNNTGYAGMLLISTAPLLVIGLIACWHRRREPMPRFILLAALATPAVPALTVDTPHALRASIMVPFILALIGYGLGVIWPWLSLRPPRIGLVVAILLINGAGYHLDLFAAYPARATMWFDSGQIDAIRYAYGHAEGHRILLSTTKVDLYIDAYFTFLPPPPREPTVGHWALERWQMAELAPARANREAQPGDIAVMALADPAPPGWARLRQFPTVVVYRVPGTAIGGGLGTATIIDRG